MYARTFRKAHQTKRFSITPAAAAGWEVREEEDSRVIRVVRYHDWHRVERARMQFAHEATVLTRAGWTEAQ